MPLTVVCAPAGCGKTTAVGDWLASRGRRSTWLAIEATDNDVENLFSRLLSLWGDVAAAFGEGLSVVLDDFQLLTRPASHRAVEEMVDKLPASVQAIVISRTPPPLRLGRRLATGTVFEVGTDDLASPPMRRRHSSTAPSASGSARRGSARSRRPSAVGPPGCR